MPGERGYVFFTPNGLGSQGIMVVFLISGMVEKWCLSIGEEKAGLYSIIQG